MAGFNFFLALRKNPSYPISSEFSPTYWSNQYVPKDNFSELVTSAVNDIDAIFDALDAGVPNQDIYALINAKNFSITTLVLWQLLVVKDQDLFSELEAKGLHKEVSFLNKFRQSLTYGDLDIMLLDGASLSSTEKPNEFKITAYFGTYYTLKHRDFKSLYVAIWLLLVDVCFYLKYRSTFFDNHLQANTADLSFDVAILDHPHWRSTDDYIHYKINLLDPELNLTGLLAKTTIETYELTRLVIDRPYDVTLVGDVILTRE